MVVGVLTSSGEALYCVSLADHHRVAARAKLAGLATLHRLPTDRVDDLDLHVGMDQADGCRAPLHVVVGAGLGRDRRGLGHPSPCPVEVMKRWS